MILRVPSYYKEFKCIADRCKENCCTAWEIEIDEETLAYYKTLKGELGERIAAHLDGDTFVLREDGRCPMLNDNGLCDLCAAYGEEAFSEVCAEYPRFVMEYPGVREKALGVSCEEVGRLLFSNPSKSTFDEQEFPDEYDLNEWEEEEIALAAKMEPAREEAIELLQNREKKIEDRIREYLYFCEEKQKELFHTADIVRSEVTVNPYESFKERLEQYRQIEGRGNKWKKMLDRLEAFYTEENYEKTHRAFMEAYREREYEYEHLMVYYTFRYFVRAFYDNNLLNKAQLAVASFLMIRDMDAMLYAENGTFDLLDRIETVKLYARELEHSEENMEVMTEALMFEDVFSVETLLACIA